MSNIPLHTPCFGRKQDLDELQQRVRQQGVTFVMAPPRMGKTRLVRNLAFARLLSSPDENWLVGYAESSASENDLMREAIADLYKRWLDKAGMLAQARSLWDRHSGDFVGKVGT